MFTWPFAPYFRLSRCCGVVDFLSWKSLLQGGHDMLGNNLLVRLSTFSTVGGVKNYQYSRPIFIT